MPDTLRRLIETHEFLRTALQGHGEAMRPGDAARLQQDRDRTFLRLLRYVSVDPRVTLAQIKCMLSSLADLATNPEQARLLTGACEQAAARLAHQAGQFQIKAPKAAKRTRRRASADSDGVTESALNSSELSLFDAMSDRVAVMDRTYTYVFANRANAAFHGLPKDRIIGQKSWSIVGYRCFSELTKPKLDECFAGLSFSMFARHLSGARSMTCSARFDPVRNESGEVVSALVLVRDVTNIHVPDSDVWIVPRD